MADAVLSVEVRARLEKLSSGLKQGEKNIGDFVAAGDRNLSKIEARFESLGKTTKDIANNIKTALGGVSLDQYMKSFGDGSAIIEKSKVEVQKYKEEIERLKKVSQDLSNQIKEKTKALNDAKIASEQARAATEGQRKATEAERTALAATRTEIARLTLEKKTNTDAISAASGSYREAQQRLSALGKAIREAEGGFDSSKESVKLQINEYGKLNQKLKEFDAQMGNHQRNVGHYERAMGNANNVSQEFARIIQDAPYGMRGIANNVQQLTSNWGYYVEQMKEANAAQGKTTTTGGLLRGVLQNMISPMNLLTIGVALATSGWVAYEMWTQKAEKAAEKKRKELEKTKDVLQKYLESLSAVASAQLDSEKAAKSEARELNSLWKAYNNTALSQGQRLTALKQIMSENPAYFSGLKTEDYFTNKVADSYDRLRSSIILAAKARAYGSKIEDNEKSLIDEDAYIDNLQRKLNSLNSKISPYTRKIIEGIASGTYSGQSSGLVSKEEQEAHNEALKTEKELGSRRLNRFKINQQNLQLEERYNSLQEQQLKYTKIQQDFDEGKINKKQYDKQIKEQEKLSAEKAKIQLSLEKLLIESGVRVNSASLTGVQKEIQAINDKYDNFKRRAIESVKNASDASSTIAQLEKNRIAEVEAFAIVKMNEGIKKREDEEKKLNKRIADAKLKVLQDNIDVELTFSRKFDETATQRSLRMLNAEYKKLATNLQNELRGQVSLGVNVDSDDRQDALQDEYFKKSEEIYKKEQQMRVDMVDTRNLFNASLEKTNVLLDDNARKFQAGAISAEQFQKVQATLLQEQDNLNALKGVYDNFTNGVSSAFANMLTGTESFASGMENVLRNLVTSLLQQMARLAAMKLFGAILGAATGGVGGVVMGALPGMSSGGYTGNMGVNTPAAIVHGQEFVFDAASTKRIGVDNLKAMQSGKIPTVSDFTPRIAKNNSNFSPSSQSGASRVVVDVNVGGRIHNNEIKLSGNRATRVEKKFGRG